MQVEQSVSHFNLATHDEFFTFFFLHYRGPLTIHEFILERYNKIVIPNKRTLFSETGFVNPLNRFNPIQFVLQVLVHP